MPVIFITGNDTMEDRKKGFELGAADFITKPFDKGAVLAAVNGILFPAAIPKGITALIADHELASRKVTANCLLREGIDVTEVESGEEACEILRQDKENIDIVITALKLPDMNGNSLCHKIRKEFSMPHVPVIVLTGVSTMHEILEVFKAGASDYLVKPFAREELLARSSVHIERNRINRELSETIENLRAANEKIKRLSIRDPLTGCYNRGYLNAQLAKEIKRATRYQSPLSLLMTDIDHFKKVNDTYGHAGGDQVLKTFVQVARTHIREELDWVSRYGGEEFVIVLPETKPEGAKIVSEKLRAAVEETEIPFEDKTITITASFGVATYQEGKSDSHEAMERLLKKADDHLYSAKTEGRNRVVADE